MKGNFRCSAFLLCALHTIYTYLRAFVCSSLFLSFIGAFIAILSLALLHTQLWEEEKARALLLGSFGASIMLIFGAPAAPFSQPRNVIGGHIVSACIGVFVRFLLVDSFWLAAAFSVAGAVFFMQLLKVPHPPGGATALIAIAGGEHIKSSGFLYIISPTATGAVLLVCVGVLVNNLNKKTRYPLRWF